MLDSPPVAVARCTFSYGKARALDGVSFEVPRGVIYGLLGPNGSGKTTLFRILSALLRPESGMARIFGVDVAASPIKARRQIGVVFQSQSLDRRLTVEENLAHQGHMHGLWGRALADRISELLEKVGLGDRRKDRVDTLSGGLRRRADLAKGLLHSPRLLLLDEPSTGVDPQARLVFWSYLEGLRSSEGVTVLLTTHLLEEADSCDRLAILDHGRLIREGTPDDLKAEIGGEVVTLSSTVPDEIAATLKDEFAITDALVSEHGVRFEHPEASAWAARLMERFGSRVQSVKISHPSLEDVFLHHAGRGYARENGMGRTASDPTS